VVVGMVVDIIRISGLAGGCFDRCCALEMEVWVTGFCEFGYSSVGAPGARMHCFGYVLVFGSVVPAAEESKGRSLGFGHGHLRNAWDRRVDWICRSTLGCLTL